MTITTATRAASATDAQDDAALVRALGPACGGAVHAPGDSGYDAARRAWQLAVDQRPAAVVYPADAHEVAAVMRLAAATGRPVVPQATGHNARPAGPLDGAILLRTGAMRDIVVDPVRRIARVGAGALWVDVVAAVAPYGLMALHGSSPDVGVTGYALGGGIGWYARAYGLQCNDLVAVELALADGRVLRASADEEPDLFWALRGGGGSFGVVTALELRLHPIASAYAGWLVWDWRDAHAVTSRWAEWALDAPDAATTSCRILQLPHLESIAAPLRGRRIVAIDGAVLGSDPDAERVLAPLRELAPELDTFTRQPAAALIRLHGDPEEPTSTVSASTLLGALPAEGVAAFVEATGPGSGSGLLLAELRQLGGALARTPLDGGALSRLDGRFLALAAGMPTDVASEAALVAEAERVMALVGPWATGRRYGNFTEAAVDPATFFAPADLDRLRAIRALVDPAGLVRANHRI